MPCWAAGLLHPKSSAKIGNVAKRRGERPRLETGGGYWRRCALDVDRTGATLLVGPVSATLALQAGSQEQKSAELR